MLWLVACLLKILNFEWIIFGFSLCYDSIRSNFVKACGLIEIKDMQTLWLIYGLRKDGIRCAAFCILLVYTFYLGEIFLCATYGLVGSVSIFQS